MNDLKQRYRLYNTVAKQLLTSIAGIVDERRRCKHEPTWGDCGDLRHVNEQLAYVEALLKGEPDNATRNLVALEKQLAKKRGD